MDYERLREIAEKASPGPWFSDEAAVPWTPRQRSPFTENGASVGVGDNEVVIVQGGQQDEQGGAVGVLTNENAEHIATFDPHTVLALLDDLAAARARIDELEGLLRETERLARGRIAQSFVMTRDGDAYTENRRAIADALARASATEEGTDG